MILNNATRRGIALFVVRTLTQNCCIEREVRELDSLNSPTRRREIMADDVKCRIISVGRNNRENISEQGAQETMPERYRIIVETTVPLDVDVTITCEGSIYKVVGATGNWTDEVFREYMVVMRRGDGGE